MAVITALTVSKTPAAVTKVAATATTGDTIALDVNTVLFVENGGGSPITATVTSHASAGEGEAVTDKTFSVAAGATEAVYLDPNAFTDPVTSLAKIVCSVVTSVKLYAIEH